MNPIKLIEGDRKKGQH